MKTIHVIFNAHIDPVWLWPWQSSLDELLATCRSACDRLDAHPDVVFTRGEAWVYQQIERVDPTLFERIKGHLRDGRWEIVGGWWVQPDCNQPSGFALERSIMLGKEYFHSRFGQFTRIAYNVDSFGHAAPLPTIMRKHGQDRYIMMRPQEHEMALPGRVFRWREQVGGAEVVTFRIAGGYCNNRLTLEHCRRALQDLPEGIEHTMCFAGMGDHGGGPSEKMIAWCREHRHAIEGCEIVFSSPSRYFDTIADRVETLPLVTGELQHHAIGCYSVYRPIKTRLRKAEHLMAQAQQMLDTTDDGAAPDQLRLDGAWEKVCFNQFHDTLGGTCLPSAYIQVLDQLGHASSIADESLQLGFRRRMLDLPEDPLQQIVALNMSEAAFDGYIEFEPWLGWQRWQPEWTLIDNNGQQVPFQHITEESSAGGINRLLFKASVEPGQMRVWRIKREGKNDSKPSAVGAGFDEIWADNVIKFSSGKICIGDSFVTAPVLHLVDDVSDTWSHGIDRFADGPATTPQWNDRVLLDTGPVMASLRQTGRIGDSQLTAEWRVYAAQPYVELILDIHWVEKRKLLKLVVPLTGSPTERVDGVMGGSLRRPNSGVERPLRDWTYIEGDTPLAILCPDAYAIDCTPGRARITLLRSPLMAYHDPHPGTPPRPVFADQGEHRFVFRFYAGSDVTPDLLDNAAIGIARPVLLADYTRGMPIDY